MKNLLILVALLCPVVSLQSQSVSDEYDMQVVARKFMTAYNQQDHAALQEIYLEDAVRIESNGHAISGAENIADYFSQQFQKNNTTLLIRQSKLFWSDAVHTFLAEGTYEIFGNSIVYNKKIQINGTYSNTMIKDREGQWRIAKSVLTPLSIVKSSPENVGIIDKLYHSLATGNLPSLLANMDDQIVWNEAENSLYADHSPYIGPEAVLNGVFDRINKECEYWNLTDIKLHNMENNQVLATLRYQAKCKKTGAVIDSQTAHLWTLKDGKVKALQQFIDTKQIAEAMTKPIIAFQNDVP